MEETFSPIPEERAPKKRGCFFYGCIASIILLVLIGIGIYLVVNAIKGQIVKYTEDAPRALPQVDATPEQQQAVKDRIADFDAAVKAEPDKPAAPLVLTADDVNALIASEPTFKGKVFVTIPGNTVEAAVSMPLESLGFPGTKGRYLNGKAGLEVGFAMGSLIGHITSLEVKGQKVPDEFIQGMKGSNLFDGVNREPKNRSKLDRIEGIEVKDGKLIVKLKAKADAPAPPKDEAKVEPPKEEPKAEAPKVEPPKEQPKADAPKPEAPKEEPKADAPKRAA